MIRPLLLSVIISIIIPFVIYGQTSIDEIKMLLETAYQDPYVDYLTLSKQVNLDSIEKELLGFETSNMDDNEKLAFLINGYNVIVITEVIKHYPIESVELIPGFFTKKHVLGEELISLNDLEKLILRIHKDASIHFALNCGAISCPQVEYLHPSTVENQISVLVKMNIDNKAVVEINEDQNSLILNKIFFWYKDDFNKYNQDIKTFISRNIDKDVSKYKTKFQEYNWALNDVSWESQKSQKRFYPVKIYSKGEIELKVFNNYYTQTDHTNIADQRKRSSYFSSFVQLLFGTNKNFNWGVDLKIRSVELLNTKGNLFHALQFNNLNFNEKEDILYARSGISMVGARVKYQPFRNHTNINFLHSIYISTFSEAEGGTTKGFVDFDGVQIYNQLFFEKILGSRSSLFVDAGFFIEGLKTSFFKDQGAFTQMSWPVTGIWSYYPDKKTTLYFLAGLGPKIGLDNRNGSLNSRFDGYAQLGPGVKYFVSEKLELELLYTQFLTSTAGQKAATFNLGIRYKN